MMKIFFTAALYFALSTTSYADVQIKDLPYLEGTPVTAPPADGTGWTLLDSAQINSATQWAWLEHLGGEVYVIYPTDVPSVTFPDGKTFKADALNISLYFINNTSVEFTRFGGEIILEGKEITARYAVDIPPNKEQGNHYLVSEKSVVISGAYSATLSTTGTIKSILLTPFNDIVEFQKIFHVVSNFDGGGGGDTLYSNDTGSTNSGLSTTKIPCGQTGVTLVTSANLQPLEMSSCGNSNTLPINNSGSGLLVSGTLTVIGWETSWIANLWDNPNHKKSKGGSIDGVLLGLLGMLVLRRPSLIKAIFGIATGTKNKAKRIN